MVLSKWCCAQYRSACSVAVTAEDGVVQSMAGLPALRSRSVTVLQASAAELLIVLAQRDHVVPTTSSRGTTVMLYRQMPIMNDTSHRGSHHRKDPRFRFEKSSGTVPRQSNRSFDNMQHGGLNCAQDTP